MRRPLALVACLLLPAAPVGAQGEVGAALVVAAPAYPREVELQACSAMGESLPAALIEVWPDARAAGLPPADDPGAPAAPPAGELCGAWTCDPSGRARVRLPSREAVVVASVPGLASSGAWEASALEGATPELQLFPLGEVRGAVRTLDGGPVAGARVEFRADAGVAAWVGGVRGPGRPRGPRDLLTGPDGTFAVAVDWGWCGVARALRDERVGEWESLTWTSGLHHPSPLLLPGPWFVRGRCLDETGAPVPGVALVARVEGVPRAFRTRSDEAGRFALAAGAGGTVRVGAEGPVVGPDGARRLALAEAVVRLDAARPVAETTLHLVRTAALEGRVLDTTGQPFEERGVSVRVVQAGRMSHRTVLVDAQGRFRCEDLEARLACDLLVERHAPPLAPWAPMARRVRGVLPGGPPLELRLGARDGLRGRCTVRVLDAVTGAPVPFVNARPSWPGSWEGLSWSGGLDARRAARTPLVLDRLPLDVPTALDVEAPGYASLQVAELPVDRGDGAVLELALQPLVPLSVRVLAPDGSAGAGAWVVVHELARPGEPPAWRPGAITDAQGRATLATGAGAGERVLLQARDGTRESGPVELLAPPPGSEVVLRLLEAPPRREVEVRVMDAAGEPVAGTCVRLETEPWSWSPRSAPHQAACTARTDAAGRALFDGVAPGAWKVSLPRGPGSARTSLLLTADGPAACELRVASP